MAPLLIMFGSRPTRVLQGKRELSVSLRLPVVYVMVKFVQTHTWKDGTLKIGECKIDGRLEVTGIRGRRRKQLRGNLENG
jgi:hypothetical protein